MKKIPFVLQPFDSRAADRLSITVSGKVILDKNLIQISYQLQGNVNEINLPQHSERASRKDKLWESTCFELFITKTGISDYWEYNLSPSKDWAVFRFTDYRENKTDELTISNIVIDTRIDNGTLFELNSSLPLPDTLAGHRIRVGISAVIQDNSNDIHYYALDHHKQQPDFHDRKSFTISLEA
ncbi:DOMON-like domain-containing protein [Kaarinaea lacus]